MLAALALIPAAANAQSTITACYVPKTGSVYRIEAAGAPEACKNGHVEFSWTSAAASYGPVTVVSTPITIAPSAESIVVAQCPEGSVALSGGYTLPTPIFPPIPDLKLIINARLTGGDGWMVYAKNNSVSDGASFIVQAYCATVTP
jgi:hypothetical protein